MGILLVYFWFVHMKISNFKHEVGCKVSSPYNRACEQKSIIDLGSLKENHQKERVAMQISNKGKMSREDVKAIMKEVKFLRKVNHPYIVQRVEQEDNYYKMALREENQLRDFLAD